MPGVSDKTTDLKRFNPCNRKGPRFKPFSKSGKRKEKEREKRTCVKVMRRSGARKFFFRF
jgi:hypothetical protein